jgi:hypothetical protein
MVTTHVEHENRPVTGLFPLKLMPSSLGNPVIAASGTDPALPLQASEGLNRGEVNRLVILLPDEDVDEARLSRYIWSLASPGKLGILLVTLVSEPGEEFTALRRMTRIGGITQDIWINVKAKVIFGRAWRKALAQLLQPEDLLICPAEKRVTTRVFSHMPLSLALSSTLNRPVYLLKDFYADNRPAWPHWARQIPFWIGCLAILGVFTTLEIDIGTLGTGWAGQVIFIGLVTAEIGCLYLLNVFNGQ